MNWTVKAFIQKVLAKINVGDTLNHLPTRLKRNYHSNVFQYQFFECIRKLEETTLNYNNSLVALEIGTGYSLVAPITLHLLGFHKIISVDISNDISYKNIKKQLHYLQEEKFKSLLEEKSIYTKAVLNQKISSILKTKNLKELLSNCNIKYIIKYTLKDIENECNSFDYIYSQVVFEHIEPAFLEALFIKFKTWLNNTGYSVHTINFIDHFANPGFFQDKKISEFNFLKYSDAYWKYWAGNEIAYTNRLSFLFYLNLCEKNNFNSVKFNGENYRKSIPFNVSEIHSDILKNYQMNIDKNDLIKYQRGTLVFNKA